MPTRAPTGDESKKHLEPYAIAMGELIYGWNHLQEELANLFWRVTGIKNGAIPFAIWHSTPSDHNQRMMLRAATEVTYARNKEAREAIIWLLDRIDNSLRHKRNDAIHAPLVLNTDALGTSVIPYDWTNNPRAGALLGKEILKELIWYRETTDVLRNYSWELRHALHPTRPHALPKKPELPHLGPQTRSKGKHQEGSDKAPQPRRRSPGVPIEEI